MFRVSRGDFFSLFLAMNARLVVAGCVELGSRARRWADDNLEKLRLMDPELPSKLNDRAADNWRSLVAIADTIGGSWPEAARRAALILSAADDDP